MEVKLLVLYVICQTFISTTLCGVTLPFSDFIGRVTPVKPTPLTPSTSLPAIKSSLIWDGQDIIADLFASSEGTAREFTVPLLLKSTTKSLPVPKLDTLSLSNIKIPERLDAQSIPLFNSFPSSLSSPYACISPSSLIGSSNRLLSLPSITSLPSVPLDALQKSRISSFGSNIPLSTPSFGLSPLNSLYPLPYQLYYKPMYLPRVNTPTKIFPSNYNPLFYVNDKNLSEYSYLNPIKPTGKPFPLDPVPKIPSFSAESPFTTNFLNVKNPWLQRASSPSIVFESNIVKPIYPSSTIDFNEYFSLFPTRQYPEIQENPTLAPSDLLNVVPQTPATTTLTQSIPAVSPILPSDYFKIPELPMVSMTPPYLDSNPCNYEASVIEIDSFSNRINNFDIYDSFKNYDIPDMFPTVDNFVDKIAIINTNDLLKNFDQYTDLSNFNVPDFTSYTLPLLLKENDLKTPNESPLVIESCPSKIPQTFVPTISYANISPTSPITKTSSNIVSSVNEIVSNITQNVLSSCKSYITSKLGSYCKPKEIIPVRTQLPPVLLKQIPKSYSSNSINLSNKDCSKLLLESPLTTNKLSSPLPISSSPLSSLSSISSPQICLSHLPSPVLPCPALISSPFYKESRMIKKSSNKSLKNIERLLELMLIAELLNNDENFDWDDLDTLLAFLSVT